MKIQDTHKLITWRYFLKMEQEGSTPLLAGRRIYTVYWDTCKGVAISGLRIEIMTLDDEEVARKLLTLFRILSWRLLLLVSKIASLGSLCGGG